MKSDFVIFAISVFLVLSVSFFLFGASSLGITGLVVGESDVAYYSEGTHVSRQDALLEIESAEQVLLNLQESNFSTNYLEDLLIEANKTLIVVDYAEILRNNLNSSAEQKNEARNALRLVDWDDLNYSAVLEFTSEISERYDEAYEVYDSFAVIESSLNRYSDKGVDVSEAGAFLSEARNAFFEERYEDSKIYIDKARNNLENLSAELSTFNELQRSAKGFFLNYWYYVLLVLIILILLAIFTNRKIRRRLLKKKINYMIAEKKAINELMKDIQIKRFKENKISGLVYNLRMKKYEEKLNKIKEQLPVLEYRLSGKKRLKTE